MHNYQKLQYVVLALSLGISATASAKTFPQDYVNVNSGFQTMKADVDEIKPRVDNGLSLTDSGLSTTYHIHELTNSYAPSSRASVNETSNGMADLSTTPSTH